MPQGMPPEYQKRYATPKGDYSVARVSISDDGTRIVFFAFEPHAYFLLSKGPDGWMPHLLYPSVDWNLLNHMDESFAEGDSDYGPIYYDMGHIAISPDGRFVAFGKQSAGHFISEIGADGVPSRYASLAMSPNIPTTRALMTPRPWLR